MLSRPNVTTHQVGYPAQMSLNSRLAEFLRPHKTIPVTPWRAQDRWDLSISRVAILFFGLSIFGIGESLLIQSKLGNAPWSVLAQGLAKTFNSEIGLLTFAISAVVLLFWIPLKEKPGFGTLANIALIAAAIQLGIDFIPPAENILIGLGYIFFGIALVGAGSSLYITCGLGPGPRDGLMTAIHHRSGIRVGRVRLAIEGTVLVLGALLGGTLGIGTALFALLIGQSIAIFLGIVARLTSNTSQ
jgi:uncharacterized membrane protein YczE